MITKFIYALMVLTIFNPFCCCTAAGLFADGSDLAAASHSCCAASGDEQSSDEQHDPENCPHKALKDYEIASHQDARATNTADLLQPTLFVVLDSLVYEPVFESTHPNAPDSAVGPPPVSLTQVYCVYRI